MRLERSGVVPSCSDLLPRLSAGTTATLARLASLLKRPGLPEQDDINIALQDMTGAQEDDRADVKPLASPAWPIERLPPTNEADVEGMRYLAYSPHSGLHNQRIALENAIVLAQLLNRTLLLPPLRLGKPLRWANNEALQDRLTKPSYVPSSVCSRNRLGAEDYRECTSRRAEFSELSWDWLVDLNGRFEGTDLRLVNRQNLSMAWMTDSVERGGLGVQPKDILTIEDGSVSVLCRTAGRCPASRSCLNGSRRRVAPLVSHLRESEIREASRQVRLATRRKDPEAATLREQQNPHVWILVRIDAIDPDDEEGQVAHAPVGGVHGIRKRTHRCSCTGCGRRDGRAGCFRRGASADW